MPAAAANPVLIVIRYLGRIAVALAVGDLVLTWRVLDLAGKAGAVDPVAVGAVGAITAALTGVLGALAAMLVSTKIGPTPEEMAAQLAELAPPEPTPVVGPGGGPVEVVDAEEEAPPAPKRGR